MARKKSKPRIGERHSHILEVLQAFQDEKGYIPSVREIGETANISSTSVVNYYLDQLEEAGFIERRKRVARSIRLLKPFTAAARQLMDGLRVPMLGRIAAGLPLDIPASDFSLFDSESSVELPVSLFPVRDLSGPFYALEVQGDSMVDAMVNHGDIVIIRPANQANNGEMIAAWLVEQEATTLKYFFWEDGRVRLQPANPKYDPLFLDNPEEQLLIQGKVVMVVRQFSGLAA